MQESFDLPVEAAPTADAAVTGADVVVLLTTATQPFLKPEWLSEGCLALGMGSYQQAEDALILGADKIIVDSWGQAEHRGELKPLADTGQLTVDYIAAELGDVVAGIGPGRTAPEERVLAVLVGLGAHDVYIAGQVYERALSEGVGQRVCLRQSEGCNQ